MDNVYKPHRYLFGLAKKIPPATIIASILCWLPTVIINMLLLHHMYMPLVRLSLAANVTVFFIALFFSMVLHEICGTTYSLSERTIVKKSPYKTSLIHFENVTQFLYIRLPLVKGYGLVRVPTGSIRLPFLIDNLEKCIEDIRQRLAVCGKQDVYDPGNLAEYTFKAVINGVSVRRMERTIPVLFQIVIGGIAESAFIAQFFWGMSLKWVLSWTFSGIVFPVMGYLMAGMILNRFTIRKAMHNRTSPLSITPAEGVNATDESKIYWLVGLITALAYIITGIVFKKIIVSP